MEFTSQKDIQILIQDLKGLRVEHFTPGTSASGKIKIIPADSYDLRTICKLEAKKLSRLEIDSLIEYGTNYLKEYSTGKWAFRKTGRQYEYADFDEAEASVQIKAGIEVLKEEIKRRG